MHKPIPTLALIAAMLGAPVAASAEAADEWNLLLNGRAVHVGASKDWNENNVGLGIEREFDANARWVKLAMANGYRDSDDEMAYMAGGGIKRRFRIDRLAPDWHLDLGLIGFLMTRQDVDNNRRFPGALPVLSIGNDDLALNMTYLPASGVANALAVGVEDPAIDGVLFLQFSFNMGLFRPGHAAAPLLASEPGIDN